MEGGDYDRRNSMEAREMEGTNKAKKYRSII
jgi:hypothetical protein